MWSPTIPQNLVNNVFERDVKNYPHGPNQTSLDLAYSKIMVAYGIRFLESLSHASLYSQHGLSMVFLPFYTISKRIGECGVFSFLRGPNEGVFDIVATRNYKKPKGTFPLWIFHIDGVRYVIMQGQAIELSKVNESPPS